MTPARLAGALLLLLPVLVTACGGHRDTKLEHRIRTYINSNQRYVEILADEPFDAKVDTLRCREFTSGPYGGHEYGCEITLRGGTTHRWEGSERNGKFSFRICEGERGERVLHGAYFPNPPCEDPLG